MPAGLVGARGTVAPRGTARALVTRINREINAIAEDAEVKSRALAQGTDLEAQTPEQFAAQTKAEFEIYKQVVVQQKLKLD